MREGALQMALLLRPATLACFDRQMRYDKLEPEGVHCCLKCCVRASIVTARTDPACANASSSSGLQQAGDALTAALLQKSNILSKGLCECFLFFHALFFKHQSIVQETRKQCIVSTQFTQLPACWSKPHSKRYVHMCTGGMRVISNIRSCKAWEMLPFCAHSRAAAKQLKSMAGQS